MVLQYKMASTLGNDMRFKYHFLSLSTIRIVVSISECGKDRICVTHIFGKNFVKATFKLKSWFHEIFFSVRVNFSFFHTVQVCQNFVKLYENFFSAYFYHFLYFCLYWFQAKFHQIEIACLFLVNKTATKMVNRLIVIFVHLCVRERTKKTC